MTAGERLWWIKTLHTAIWAIFVASILGVSIVGQLRDLRLAMWLSLAVWVEIFVLVFNGMRCPMTDLAAHYTGDRSDNFDIFLPAWLARNNKLIFGSIFAAAELLLLRQWLIGSG